MNRNSFAESMAYVGQYFPGVYPVMDRPVIPCYLDSQDAQVLNYLAYCDRTYRYFSVPLIGQFDERTSDNIKNAVRKLARVGTQFYEKGNEQDLFTAIRQELHNDSANIPSELEGMIWACHQIHLYFTVEKGATKIDAVKDECFVMWLPIGETPKPIQLHAELRPAPGDHDRSWPWVKLFKTPTAEIRRQVEESKREANRHQAVIDSARTQEKQLELAERDGKVSNETMASIRETLKTLTQVAVQQQEMIAKMTGIEPEKTKAPPSKATKP